MRNHAGTRKLWSARTEDLAPLSHPELRRCGTKSRQARCDLRTESSTGLDGDRMDRRPNMVVNANPEGGRDVVERSCLAFSAVQSLK